MLRFCLPFFPDAAVTFIPWVVGLSVVAIVYGALVSLMQKDLKKLVAYSSVSHMGFVTAGIFAGIALVGNAAGIEGAILVMLSHGFLTGALFLMVGFIYERTHTRLIADMSSLAKPLPIAAGFLLFFAFGSLGLPGLSGFVGEFLSLFGVFEYSRWMAAVAALGVILAAAYLLWMFQRTMFNDRGDDEVKPSFGLKDLGTARDRLAAPAGRLRHLAGRVPADVPRVPARARAGHPRPRHSVAERHERGCRRSGAARRLRQGAVLDAAEQHRLRDPPRRRHRRRRDRRLRRRPVPQAQDRARLDRRRRPALRRGRGHRPVGRVDGAVRRLARVHRRAHLRAARSHRRLRRDDRARPVRRLRGRAVLRHRRPRGAALRRVPGQTAGRAR